MSQRSAAPVQRHPAFRTRSLTGIPGDILIARRARSVCLVCGLTPLVAPNACADVPWVCASCENARPARPKFDAKKERERGIEHLDRLLKEE